MYVVVAEFKVAHDAASKFGPLVDRQARDSVELEQ